MRSQIACSLLSVLFFPSLAAPQALVPLNFSGPISDNINIKQAYSDKNGVIWFATSQGLFHLAHEGRITKIELSDPNFSPLSAVSDVAGELWLGGKGGARSLSGYHVHKLVSDEGKEIEVNFVAQDRAARDRVWLGTSRGLYLGSRGEIALSSSDRVLDGSVTFLDFVAGLGLVASTTQGTYVLKRDEPGDIWRGIGTGSSITSVDRILYLGGDDDRKFFFLSGTKLFGPGPEPLFENAVEVQVVRNTLWCSDGGELLVFCDNQALSLFPGIKMVRVIREIGDYVWVATSYELLRARIEGNLLDLRFEVVNSRPGGEWLFRNVRYFPDSGVFFWGGNSVYRLDERVEVDVEIEPTYLPLLNWVSVESAFYRLPEDKDEKKDGSKDVNQERPAIAIGKFGFPEIEPVGAIIETKRSRFISRRRANPPDYKPLWWEKKFLGAGNHSIIIAIKDSNGLDFFLEKDLTIDLQETRYLAWFAYLVMSSLIPPLLLVLAWAPGLPIAARTRSYLSYRFLCNAPFPYPPRSWFVFSSRQWPVLHHIYKKRFAAHFGKPTAPLHAKYASSIVDAVGSGRCLQLAPKVQLVAAAHAILESDKESLPVISRFSRLSNDSWDQISEAVTLGLEDIFPSFGKEFCKRVLERGQIVFLLAVDHLDEDGRAALRNLAASPHRKHTVFYSFQPDGP